MKKKNYAAIFEDIFIHNVEEHICELECLAFAACSLNRKEAMENLRIFEEVIQMVRDFPAIYDEKDHYEMNVLGHVQNEMNLFSHVEKFLNYQKQCTGLPSNDIGEICKKIKNNEAICPSSLAITILHNLIWIRLGYGPFLVLQAFNSFQPYYITTSNYESSLPLDNADKEVKPPPIDPHKFTFSLYDKPAFISTIEAIALLALKIAQEPSTKRLQWEFLCSFSREISKEYHLQAFSQLNNGFNERSSNLARVNVTSIRL